MSTTGVSILSCSFFMVYISCPAETMLVHMCDVLGQIVVLLGLQKYNPMALNRHIFSICLSQIFQLKEDEWSVMFITDTLQL